jgi:hypothetical protein
MTLLRELDEIVPSILIFFRRMSEGADGGAMASERKLGPLG